MAPSISGGNALSVDTGASDSFHHHHHASANNVTEPVVQLLLLLAIGNGTGGISGISGNIGNGTGAAAAAVNLTSALANTTVTVNGTDVAADGVGGGGGASLPPGFINLVSVQCIFAVIYGIIFSIGVTGNCLVCYVVFRNRAMHTVTNFFITNLAVSDIMLCMLAVPFTPMYTFMERWVFGTAMCHLVACAQAVSVYISSLTLTAIAIDRFIVILYPFRHRMKIETCNWLILLCWTLAVILTIPYGLYVHLSAEPNNTNTTSIYYCEENWPSENTRKVFGTITFCLQFVVPFLVISVCYICVSLRLGSRARSKPGSKTAKKEEADRDRKKRTNRMLMAMVAVFGVSWLPLSVVNIVNDYVDLEQPDLIPFFMSHCLAMSSTCYNPFLYAWLNENFRKEFKQVLPCIRRSGYNDIVFGGQRDRNRLGSQADGMSVTQASQIIPRGPTCGNSLKKVVRQMHEPTATTTTTVLTIVDEAAAVVTDNQSALLEVTSMTVGSGSSSRSRNATVLGGSGDQLETHFDGPVAVTVATTASQMVCENGK